MDCVQWVSAIDNLLNQFSLLIPIGTVYIIILVAKKVMR